MRPNHSATIPFERSYTRTAFLWLYDRGRISVMFAVYNSNMTKNVRQKYYVRRLSNFSPNRLGVLRNANLNNYLRVAHVRSRFRGRTDVNFRFSVQIVNVHVVYRAAIIPYSNLVSAIRTSITARTNRGVVTQPIY